MADWKAEYLAKTFSRTNRKKWENYIITGIWHRLHDLSLQPVTQQYVKKDDGYALLDLYFPQINFAVEVDESYHENEEQREKDKEREEQVKKSLESIFAKNERELIIRRVKITDNSAINEIEKEIDSSRSGHIPRRFASQ